MNQEVHDSSPQDLMDQLFKPFRQMELSTTRLYGGTGMGLVISKNLVELMGGRIWAESLEGKGSMFHFTIKAYGKATGLCHWCCRRL